MTIDLRNTDDPRVMYEPNTGFPWLSWHEDRPSKKNVIVTCYIGEGYNRELLFGSDGGVLPDPIYRQRPWEKLVGFRAVPASELYYSGIEKRIKQEFMNYSALLRVVLPDDAIVMLADIDDGYPSMPMHLSYGIGTAVEVAALHSRLHSLFIGQRRELVDRICEGAFTLPVNWKFGRLVTEAILRSRKEEFMRGSRTFWEKLFGR